MIYAVCIYRGHYDDATWWIHSLWDCPIKADNAKHRRMAEIAEIKARPEPPHESISVNDVEWNL